MIQIKIKNIQEIIKREKGSVVAWLSKLSKDAERKVEEEVIKEIKKAFQDEGVEADFEIV
ncbi:MAG: hypothetical protein ACQESB_02120 [Elusimicrobiota bacterium]